CSATPSTSGGARPSSPSPPGWKSLTRPPRCGGKRGPDGLSLSLPRVEERDAQTLAVAPPARDQSQPMGQRRPAPQSVDDWYRPTSGKAAPCFSDIGGHGQQAVRIIHPGSGQPCRKTASGDRVASGAALRSRGDLAQSEDAQEDLDWILLAQPRQDPSV